MRYKKKDIYGFPTIEMVEECVRSHNLSIDPQKAYDYWEKKQWKTKKGAKVKSLENCIDVYNGIVVSRARKSAKQKAKKEANTHKKTQYVQYQEQLKDEKWLAFRQFIFAVRGRICEACGLTHSLQIHHLRYKKGAKAWEYTCNDVMVVCDKCHKKIHNLK